MSFAPQTWDSGSLFILSIWVSKSFLNTLKVPYKFFLAKVWKAIKCSVVGTMAKTQMDKWKIAKWLEIL